MRPDPAGHSHIATKLEIAAILRVDCDDLPVAIRERKVMVIGFEGELMRRYPGADPWAIIDWCARYINSRTYLKRVMNCRHRHDLDGNDVRRLTEDDRAFAAAVVKGRKQIDPTDINAFQPHIEQARSFA